MCVCMYGCTHAARHKWRSGTTCGIQLFSFTMWVPETEIRLSSLVAKAMGRLTSLSF